jgi:hypothetical protein
VESVETSDGVLFALGDWNGGYALFAAGGRLAFALSRAGDLIEVVADRSIPPGPQRLGVGYRPSTAGQGKVRLFHDDVVVGELPFDGGFPFVLQHGGAGLRLGFDAGLPVSPRYSVPATWNGTLLSVRIQTRHLPAPDPLDRLRSALHAD